MTITVKVKVGRRLFGPVGIVLQFGRPVEWLPNYERRGHTVRVGWLLFGIAVGWKLGVAS